jgi:hypothetical protein
MGALGWIAVAVVYGLCQLAWWAVKYSVLGLYFIGMALFKDNKPAAVGFAVIAAILLVVGAIFINIAASTPQY